LTHEIIWLLYRNRNIDLNNRNMTFFPNRATLACTDTHVIALKQLKLACLKTSPVGPVAFGALKL